MTTDRREEKEEAAARGFRRGSRQVFCNRFVWCGFAVRASTHLRPNRRLSRKLWHSAAKDAEKTEKMQGTRKSRQIRHPEGRDSEKMVKAERRNGGDREKKRGWGRKDGVRERLSAWVAEERRDCCVETSTNLRCLPRLVPNQAVSSLNVDEPACLLTSWGISLGVARGTLIKKLEIAAPCLSTIVSRHE